jgi:hypothetical protein
LTKIIYHKWKDGRLEKQAALLSPWNRKAERLAGEL